MRTIISAMIFIPAACSLLSCSKHNGDIEENIPSASIMVANPVANAVYNNNDSVNIQAVAISSAVIHGYDVTIKRPNDTTVLFFNHVHDHNDTLYISQKWKNTTNEVADFEAQVSLDLDHEGHTSTKKVRFKMQ
jgi:hypothetical protein